MQHVRRRRRQQVRQALLHGGQRHVRLAQHRAEARVAVDHARVGQRLRRLCVRLIPQATSPFQSCINPRVQQ